MAVAMLSKAMVVLRKATAIVPKIPDGFERVGIRRTILDNEMRELERIASNNYDMKAALDDEWAQGLGLMVTKHGNVLPDLSEDALQKWAIGELRVSQFLGSKSNKWLNTLDADIQQGLISRREAIEMFYNRKTVDGSVKLKRIADIWGKNSKKYRVAKRNLDRPGRSVQCVPRGLG